MNWLPRDLINSPYLALVLSPAEFDEAMAECGILQEDRGPWLKNDKAHATAHFLDNPEGEQVTVVALKVRPGVSGVQICGLLTHEAVHVFQRLCERMGEQTPSWEFAAYSIQGIAQRLMHEYSQRLTPQPEATHDA